MKYDESVKIRNSEVDDSSTLYRNVSISESILQAGTSVGDDSQIVKCQLGRNVLINRRSYLFASIVGRCSYCGINTTMNFVRMGGFCSVGRNVNVGCMDHNYHSAATIPAWRLRQMYYHTPPASIIGVRSYCEIGNDVWIADGVRVLHKVSIADGAVIGAGAVVTKDVPPYAIVVGVPARVVGFRFSDAVIASLLRSKWWDWPDCEVSANIELLTSTIIDLKHAEMIEQVSSKIKQAKKI